MTHPDFNRLDKLQEVKKELTKKQEISWLLGTACRLLKIEIEISRIVERLKI